MKLNYIVIIGIIGLGFSLFYGFCATKIFLVPDVKDKTFAWKFQQFCLNFLGSAAGWIGLMILYPGIIRAVQGTPSYDISKGGILLFLLTFTGITGYLPLAIITIIQGLSLIISKIPAFLKLDK